MPKQHKTMKKLLFTIIFFTSLLAVKGQTWSSINSPTNLRIKSCSFINQDTGWVITSDLIFKTINGGLSWTGQNYPPDPPTDTRFFNRIHFINSSVGIIACGNYLGSGTTPSLVSTILWTNDGGVNWVYKDLGNPSGYDLDARLASPTVAYAVGQYGKGKKTSDGGATWTSVNYTGLYSGVKLFSINKDSIYFAGLDNFDLKGAFGKTSNGGAAWNVTTISTNTSMQSVFFNDYSNGWICGYGGEIKRTANAGTNWTSCNTGITSRINDIAFTNSSSGWAITADGKIIHSNDGGLNWNIEYSGSVELTSISFTKPNNIGYAVGDSGRILKSAIYAGINNFKKSSNIKTFPNPFYLSTTLLSDELLNNATITIDNCFGSTVKQIKNISGRSVTLFIDDLPPGVYFLYLTGDRKIFVDKLIILDH